VTDQTTASRNDYIACVWIIVLAVCILNGIDTLHNFFGTRKLLRMAQAKDVALVRSSTDPNANLPLVETFSDALGEGDDSMQCTVCAL